MNWQTILMTSNIHLCFLSVFPCRTILYNGLGKRGRLKANFNAKHRNCLNTKK